MEVTEADVLKKIRERREGILKGAIAPRPVRRSLVSIDDEEVATYRIEITTDTSLRRPLPAQFSKSATEEYLAEFDLVPVDDEHSDEEQDADDLEKRDSVGQDVTPEGGKKVDLAVIPKSDSPGRLSTMETKNSEDGIVNGASLVETPTSNSHGASSQALMRKACEKNEETVQSDERASPVEKIDTVHRFHPPKEHAMPIEGEESLPIEKELDASVEPEASVEVDEAMFADTVAKSSPGRMGGIVKRLVRSTPPRQKRDVAKAAEPDTVSTPLVENNKGNESIDLPTEKTPTEESLLFENATPFEKIDTVHTFYPPKERSTPTEESPKEDSMPNAKKEMHATVEPEASVEVDEAMFNTVAKSSPGRMGGIVKRLVMSTQPRQKRDMGKAAEPDAVSTPPAENKEAKQERIDLPTENPPKEVSSSIEELQEEEAPPIEEPQEKEAPPIEEPQEKEAPPIEEPQEKEAPPIEEPQEETPPSIERPPNVESLPIERKEEVQMSVDTDAASQSVEAEAEAVEETAEARSTPTLKGGIVRKLVMSTPVRRKKHMNKAAEHDPVSTPVIKNKNRVNKTNDPAATRESPTRLAGSDKESTVSFNLDNIITPIEKKTEDDDTKSLTTTSSESFLTSPTIRSQVTDGKVTGEGFIESLLETALDKVTCPCVGSFADPEERVVESHISKRISSRKQISNKAPEEAEEEMEVKMQLEEPEKQDKTILPKIFCSNKKQESKNSNGVPTIPEWGMKPSEDQSETTGGTGSETSPKGVMGQFFQSNINRLRQKQGKTGNPHDAAAAAVLDVQPVRLSRDGSEDSGSFIDYDDATYGDSDSEYTTEVVRVDYDPAKLAGTTDADKYLAREVLRRYAEMTGVSLDELIEEVVDESLASVTLDTYPSEA